MISVVKRRSIIIVAVAVAGCLAVAAGTTVAVDKARRDREWAHGGDSLTTRVEMRVAEPAAVPAAVTALGGPRVTPEMLLGAQQAVVVRVSWTGPARAGSSYQLIALDSRASPAGPLPVYEGWGTRAGRQGTGWDGRNNELAQHYEWLAGIASAHTGDGRTDDIMTVDAPATSTGNLAAIFLVHGHARMPFPDNGAGVLVALFCTDDNGVRWAKRVTG